MKTILVLALAALAFLVIACSDDDDSTPATPTPTVPGSETPAETPTDEPEDPTPTPTEEPQEGEAPGGLYGHGKRTGVPEIDRILQAWEDGDIPALVALALLQQQECTTTVEGIGGPPKCPEGIADGSDVDVLLAAACEGYWVYEDGLGDLFEGFVDGRDGKAYYLYAAWRSEGDDHLPAGFRLQFARSIADQDIFSPQLVLDEDGNIHAYFGGCNPAPVQVPNGADFVLEPREGGIAGTGIPSVDNFLRIRLHQDYVALEQLVTYTPVACKLRTEETYYVHCEDGQPSGTMVDAWPWWGCHGAWSNGGTTEQIAQFFSSHGGQIAKVLRFEPSGTVDMFPAHASLAVIFEQSDEQAWAAVLDDDGNFYGMVAGCPLNVDGLAEFHFDGAEMLWEA